MIVRVSRSSQRPRLRAYLLVRGGSIALFVLSVGVLDQGVWAGLGCLVAGVIGVLGCVGVNAGGPGERAGAGAWARGRERQRVAQGEWPPYPEERIIEGEVLAPLPRQRGGKW